MTQPTPAREADHSPEARRYLRQFTLVLAAVTAFRLWFLGQLPLSGDETYHWEWSRHLAWGYYDHPGLTAYLIRFFTGLSGVSTEFSVRLAATAMLTGTAIIAFALARRVTRDRGGDETAAARAGWWAGLLIIATPLFSVFAVYISTDPPFIFFWTLTLYLFYRALTGGSRACWLAAGAAAGLAMLSKFLTFLIFPALAIYVLASRENRRWLMRPEPYLAALTALAVFSPCLYWNATHGWATFVFNFVTRQQQNTFAPWHALEYLGGQALAVSPVVFVAAVWALATAWRAWRRDGDRVALYLGLTSLITLAWFLQVGLTRRVGAHWPAAGWIGLLVYLASRWSYNPRAPAPDQSWMPRLRSWALGTCILLSLTAHALAVALPHVPASWLARGWSYHGDPNKINTSKLSEIYGWHSMGRTVRQTTIEMGVRSAPARPDVFLISDSYATASAVSFYTPDHPYVHLWAPRSVHGENYRFWDNFAPLKGQNALFISRKDAGRSLGMLKRHFARLDAPERLSIVREGRVVRTFDFVRAYGFDGQAPDFSQAVKP
ncbi:MAG: glycosyltransferase family 39 protein [bacterium]